MRSFVVLLFLLSFDLALLDPSRTLADGCFFNRSETIGSDAQSPNQRAVVIHRNQMETLILQVKYSGQPSDFSWVIPVPALPADGSISEVDDGIFQDLHDYTQPRLYYRLRNLGTGKSGGGKSQAPYPLGAAVQIWQKLQTKFYEITVISGLSSQTLINWLKANGYDFPERADPIVDFYAGKHWYFVAVRVRLQGDPEASGSTYQAGLPAIQISFETEKPVFPLRISELSAAGENEIELYVATEHRAVTEGFPTVTLDPQEVGAKMEQGRGSKTGIACACKRLTAPEYDYEAIFRDEMQAHHQAVFICEAAVSGYTAYDPVENPRDGLFDGFFNSYFLPNSRVWITRLRTFLPPDRMTQDVSFVPDPKGDRWYRLTIFLEEDGPNYGSAAFGVLLPLLSTPLLVRRKRRVNQRVLLIALLLFLIAIS